MINIASECSPSTDKDLTFLLEQITDAWDYPIEEFCSTVERLLQAEGFSAYSLIPDRAKEELSNVTQIADIVDLGKSNMRKIVNHWKSIAESRRRLLRRLESVRNYLMSTPVEMLPERIDKEVAFRESFFKKHPPISTFKTCMSCRFAYGKNGYAGTEVHFHAPVKPECTVLPKLFRQDIRRLFDLPRNDLDCLLINEEVKAMSINFLETRICLVERGKLRAVFLKHVASAIAGKCKKEGINRPILPVFSKS